jgi:hypothetical protein
MQAFVRILGGGRTLSEFHHPVCRRSFPRYDPPIGLMPAACRAGGRLRRWSDQVRALFRQAGHLLQLVSRRLINSPRARLALPSSNLAFAHDELHLPQIASTRPAA